MSINRLEGVIQRYAWGGKAFIADLLGISKSEQPIAEYWMGAHHKAPSSLKGYKKNLDELIKENPSHWLGEKLSKTFGRLPFLFKVLDVKEMLSIQVHPTKIEAEKGFDRENKEGIPIDAPYRNYKDDNHKPEIMIALSDFWLLHGFKPVDQLSDTLKAVPELNHLLPVFESASYKGLYEEVMREPQAKTDEVLVTLRNRLLSTSSDWSMDAAEYWAIKAFDSFRDESKMDKGIYSIFFFNLIKLNKGEGIFQDSGIAHSYLEGQCMELMANSDNVLRAGLTRKHVDIEELLKHLRFNGIEPSVLKGSSADTSCEQVYHSPSLNFELSRINLNSDRGYEHRSKGFEIIMVMEGETDISDLEDKFVVGRGEAIGIRAETNYKMLAKNHSVLYKAKCSE